MSGFPSPFGGSADPVRGFDAYDEFAVGHLPAPGRFLEDHDVLTGDDHAAFHRLTRAMFEARGVYDVTFGYNLARLNLDTRHPDSGYRYAEDADDPSVLRAEFTPTTPFCPQSEALTRGSFRAWNGLSDRHEYDLVRVRVDESHHRSAEINGVLRGLADRYLETGSVTAPDDGSHDGGRGNGPGDHPTETGAASSEYDPDDAPF